MEASALKYTGGIGLQGRSPLLRLQSDERLITLVRRGNLTAFEVLVARYHARLLAFCRHLLGSREDAEDVLQEVMTAAFNAMVADERPINVRPWLYRIARNRCLNHLRRTQAVGVDSMDIHLSDGGETTADKVHKAEEFRLLVGDIQSLPESQRTALVLREMDALSYEQIGEAMETTVPSVKSLLVRARMSLAEAAQARQLSCAQVRMELAEVAEGLLAKATPPVRRHLRTCQRCASFQSELRRTSRALAALLPLGPVALLKQLVFAHLGHSAGAGSSASAGTSAGAAGAAVGSGAAAGGALVGAGGMMPIGIGALGVKAAAGLAAAALVTAGAVDLSHTALVPHAHHHRAGTSSLASAPSAGSGAPASSAAPAPVVHRVLAPVHRSARHRTIQVAANSQSQSKPVAVKLTTGATKDHRIVVSAVTHAPAPVTPPGQTQNESIATVMSSGAGSGAGSSASGSTGTPATDGGQTTSSATPPAPGSGTPDSGNTGVPLGDTTPPSSATPTGDPASSSPPSSSSPPPSGAPAPGPTDPGTTTPPPTTPPPTAPAPTGDGTTATSGSGTPAAGSTPVLGAPPA